MGKYDEIISQAKVAMTDAAVGTFNATNPASGLKLKTSVDFLRDAVARFERQKPASLFAKLKDVMLETEEDYQNEKLARQIMNATHQLNVCMRCRCGRCPFMDEHCLCQGCLLGAYVVKCQGGNGMEIRDVMPDTVRIDGRTASALEHDRQTGRDIVTLVDHNGVAVRRELDMETGRTNNI